MLLLLLTPKYPALPPSRSPAAVPCRVCFADVRDASSASDKSTEAVPAWTLPQLVQRSDEYKTTSHIIDSITAKMIARKCVQAQLQGGVLADRCLAAQPACSQTLLAVLLTLSDHTCSAPASFICLQCAPSCIAAHPSPTTSLSRWRSPSRQSQRSRQS